MKSLIYMVLPFLLLVLPTHAQKVSFEEYDLENGLHVILHQDNSAPLVITSVMYHVGGKDREDGRTGFAHFFEHLLFEGTKNIGKGEWFRIVASHGGQVNANTSQDRTYYYEIFPSNSVELGLWMESERMLHPVIEQKGVDTQNEVVKEERRLSYDNAPYGQLIFRVSEKLFTTHPYKDPNIGYMEDLDAASLEEFLAYREKYYQPDNAVLVVAGDFDRDEVKQMIENYFASIPKGEPLQREFLAEPPITETIQATAYDPNIQVPAAVLAFRTPGFKERDAYVLQMIASYLSDGKSSKLYRKLVDEQKQAVQVGAFNIDQEDYGMYLVYSLPVGENGLDPLFGEMEEELEKIRSNLISERDYQKLQNTFENAYVNSNSSFAGIANSLATYYLLYGNTSLINDQIDIYRSITREEIRDVAGKYLKPTQRLELKYMPQEPIQTQR